MKNNHYDLLRNGRKLFKQTYKPLIKTLKILHNIKDEEKTDWLFINYWLNNFIFFHIQSRNKRNIHLLNYEKKGLKIILNDCSEFLRLIKTKDFSTFHYYAFKNVHKKKLDYFLNFIYGNEVKFSRSKIYTFNIKKTIFKLCVKFFNSSLFLNISSTKNFVIFFFLKVNLNF